MAEDDSKAGVILALLNYHISEDNQRDNERAKRDERMFNLLAAMNTKLETVTIFMAKNEDVRGTVETLWDERNIQSGKIKIAGAIWGGIAAFVLIFLDHATSWVPNMIKKILS